MALAIFALWPLAASGGTAEAFLEPNRTISVASPESGVVDALLVREGDALTKGQPLATLDCDLLKASLDIARARAACLGPTQTAAAEVELYENKLAKLRPLRRDGHATQGEFDRAETDLEIARAKLLAAEDERRVAALECKRIEAQIERRTVRSPVDGVVAKVRREVGEAVLLTDPAVATIVELKTLRARFSLSHAEAAAFRKGQAVTIRVAETGQAATAHIDLVSEVADARSGTFSVVVSVSNADGALRSGMRCTVEVAGDTRLSGL